MDDIRRKVLLANKERLEKKPYDKQGYRFEVIGSMFGLFGTEDWNNVQKIDEGMIQLGADIAELGMTLSSYPHRPDLLCIMQKSEASDGR
jgi:hypothetical protein